MLLERNPFSKQINDQIASIVESYTESLKKALERPLIIGQGEQKRLDPTSITWEEYLSSSNLNQKIKEDRAGTYTYDVSVEAFLYKFNKMDVPTYIPKLLPIIKNLFPDKNVIRSGGFYYPPGGFMGWHTNCKSPDLRLYIAYASHANKSFFRYLNEEEEIVDDYDDKGITIRLFDIPKEPPHFWHCIGSDCDRYSAGFKIF